MKLLFLTHYDNMYGANRALFQLMKGLKERSGAEIILVIPSEGEMTEAVSRLGISYVICEMTQWQAVYKSPLRFLVKRHMRRKKIQKELEELTRRFEKENIDVIHSNSSVIGTGAMLAKRLGCRHVWHIREFSKEHFHMEYFYSGRYVRQLYEQADVLITISDALKENYRRRYPNANVVRIYDGVSPAEFGGNHEDRNSENKTNKTSRDDEKKQEGEANFNLETNVQSHKREHMPLRFVYVGYLFPMKHQMDVLEACSLCKRQGFEDFEIYFVGSGKPEYSEKLESRTKKLGLSNVRFLGYQKDVPKLLKQMDVGIIASEYEGFGLVTVEYMLQELPVIGRNSGGTAEIIEDGITGCLYETTQELAEAMKYMMTRGDRRSQMGQQGRERALTHFTQEQNTEAMLKLYEML